MSVSVVVFSSDAIRGALFSRVFQESGFEVMLLKNLHAAENILKTKAPELVVLDESGYFRNELEHFSSLRGLLAGVSVLVIANTPPDGSLSLGNIPFEWCLSHPLDLPLIVTKAKELLTVKHDNKMEDLKALLPDSDESGSSEDDTLSKDLMGFLGIK
ncbi:MAG: hypothetical protein HQL08_09970 [Nitrospirae bacterium]|nr:hypothetical protein [Nitrospirota bacterium]